MKLEEKLALARKEQGLSQEQAAELIGVSRQSLWKWENGAAVPRSEYLVQVAQVYGLSVSELFGEEPPENQELAVMPETVPAEIETQPVPAMRKRLAIGVCLAASVAVLCAGSFFLGMQVPREDADSGPSVIPIEDLEEREIDISEWEWEPLYPLQPWEESDSPEQESSEPIPIEDLEEREVDISEWEIIPRYPLEP